MEGKHLVQIGYYMVCMAVLLLGGFGAAILLGCGTSHRDLLGVDIHGKAKEREEDLLVVLIRVGPEAELHLTVLQRRAGADVKRQHYRFVGQRRRRRFGVRRLTRRHVNWQGQGHGVRSAIVVRIVSVAIVTGVAAVGVVLEQGATLLLAVHQVVRVGEVKVVKVVTLGPSTRLQLVQVAILSDGEVVGDGQHQLNRSARGKEEVVVLHSHVNGGCGT
mmetsp:Transcript_13780/g.50169  ORF Transcript_13780/g.50169 Transcript_13780/m.50169 type:complete len:218 (-) Transcript_13780:649-1302(-)